MDKEEEEEMKTQKRDQPISKEIAQAYSLSYRVERKGIAKQKKKKKGMEKREMGNER